MKKLKLSLENIEGVEVLTRAQLKNVFGGTSDPEESTTDGGNLCNSECSGDRWNQAEMRFVHVTEDCIYTPPIGGLPSSCFCSEALHNATACTKKN